MLYQQLFAPVLVVDDEPLVLKTICETVSALGFLDVRQANGFEQAQEILDRNRIGILITDIGLPDGDGRRLALDALKSGTIVVLMSGFPAYALMLAPELRAQAHLLEKPFGLQELRSVLTLSGRELEAVRPKF